LTFETKIHVGKRNKNLIYDIKTKLNSTRIRYIVRIKIALCGGLNFWLMLQKWP